MIYTYSSYVTMTYTVATTIMPLRPYITTTTMSLCDLYLQRLRYNDTYCLNNYYSGPMLQQLLCLHDLYLQLLRHYDLYCGNHYYVTKALYHSNYYVSKTYIYSYHVTLTHTVSTTITQALYYSNYYVFMI